MRSASQGVRENTAELASLALSDIASNTNEQSPPWHSVPSLSHATSQSKFSVIPAENGSTHRAPDSSPKPNVITEVAEPSSPPSLQSSQSSQRSPCQSALTELIKSVPPTEDNNRSADDEGMVAIYGINPVTVHHGIISQPCERTTLISRQSAYGTMKNVESQMDHKDAQAQTKGSALNDAGSRFAGLMEVATDPKSWNVQQIWKYSIRHVATLVPPVILGLLLNVLDALSYGQSESKIE